MWIFQNNEGFFTTNNSLKLENNRLLSSLLEDLSSLPRILFIDIVYLFARFFFLYYRPWSRADMLRVFWSFTLRQKLGHLWSRFILIKSKLFYPIESEQRIPQTWTFMKPVFIYKKQTFLSNSEWAKYTTDSSPHERNTGSGGAFC